MLKTKERLDSMYMKAGGDSLYMKERFGSWQIGTDPHKGKVEFKLFFPDISRDPSQYNLDDWKYKKLDKNGKEIDVVEPKPPNYGKTNIASIQVIGDFQSSPWDKATAPAMTKSSHAKGTLWTYRTPLDLPAGFYEYKYFVTYNDGEQRYISDPCARYGGSKDLNSAFVIGGSFSTVTPIVGGRKNLRDLVVYELMIDDFTDEFRGVKAPLDAVTEKLDYLQKELGINAIAFMPWTAWPGEGYNWGYEPFQYFSVEYRYANDLNKPEEKLSYLKNLISECHKRGIHVIMDGVFNHVTGNKEFPYRRLYQNPKASPYVGPFGGVFPGLTDLDFHNGCTQEYVRDVCLYWIDEFSIDGIRFDNTTNFFIWEDFAKNKPNPKGLPKLIQDIRDHVSDPNFSLTLEHLSLDAAKVANVVEADSYWNNAFYECAFEYLWHNRISPKIMNALNNHKGSKEENVATTYLSNHDHSHVTWQAGARKNEGSKKWYRTQPYAIALLTAPGTPMIQNGQEFAEDYWIMEDDEGSSRRVQPRPLRWDYPYDKFGRELLSRYNKLIKIRLNYPGLRSNNFYPENWEEGQTKFNSEGYGVDVDSGIVIYHRWGDNGSGILQRFIIVLNFSSSNRSVSVPFPENGVWEDLISNWKPTVKNNRLNFEVGSNWGHVFFRED